jgi:hypothetical protein
MSLISDLPNFIPEEHWNEYLEMRKKIKKPATEFAKKLLIKKLIDFYTNGQDLEKVLEQSIIKNWTDLYEVKEEMHRSAKFDPTIYVNQSKLRLIK